MPNYPKGKFYKGYGVFKKRNEIYNDIRIYRIPVIPRGDGTSFRLSLNYLSYVFFGLITAFSLIRKDYDIIFVFEPSPITVALPAILLKKIKRIPLCIWVLDLWPESVSAAGNLKSDLIPNILLPIVKYIYEMCDLIMVSSRGFIDSISEKGVDKSKIKYFPQWSEDIFDKDNLISETNLKEIIPKGFVIMFAGNIGEAQDFPSVVKAASALRRIKDLHWVVLGGGSREDWLKQSIIQNGLQENFHLLGQFPMENVPELYSYADALFITLKDEYIFSLTVPAKLQTYLASGKPILSMLNGEASNIINEADAGLTAKSGDYISFSKNIEELMQLDQSRISEMGNNSYSYLKKYFKSKNLLDQAEDTFINLIKDSSD